MGTVPDGVASAANAETCAGGIAADARNNGVGLDGRSFRRVGPIKGDFDVARQELREQGECSKENWKSWAAQH